MGSSGLILNIGRPLQIHPEAIHLGVSSRGKLNLAQVQSINMASVLILMLVLPRGDHSTCLPLSSITLSLLAYHFP
jgi:hypothetical protein